MDNTRDHLVSSKILLPCLLCFYFVPTLKYNNKEVFYQSFIQNIENCKLESV